MKTFCVILIGLLYGFSNGLPRVPSNEKHPDYWNNLAEEYINTRLNLKENKNIAKNVILFIGDGLGSTTITSSRILRGQINGMPGEETILKFEEFPHVALSKTYNMDRQIPDSAGTATAILSGKKTNYYMVGMDGTTQRDDCENTAGKQVTTMLDWAMDSRRKTGIVTTARITHATPAAAYAHVSNRYWEGDVNTQGVTTCRDIAQQLVDDNPHINVIMGGGRRFFLPNTTADPETNVIDKNQRQDGRNLIQEWLDHKKDRGVGFKYVWNKQMFDEADPEYTDYLLGLFEPNHMQYELDRRENGNEPSIAEMTRKAIRILRKDHNGYFLLVEGARIDHGHHDSLVKKALYETLAMEDAVKEAVEMTDEKDTLIVVTGDHSHAFDIQGYSWRGNPIFGLADPTEGVEPALDDKPYTTLMYSNGPGYVEPRANLTSVDLEDKELVWPSGLPVEYETHGGEDVPIYAKGPMAHMFHGVHEQSYVAHVMALAACVGPYKGKKCIGHELNEDKTCAGEAVLVSTQTVMISLLFYLIMKYF